MSFVAAATAIGLEGIAANIAAGAMMGGSVKVASNVVSGQDPFKDVGRSLITGGITGGFAPGVAETFNIGMPAAAGIVSGGIETLATGSLSRGLMAGMGAYGMYGLAEGMSGAGANSLTTTMTGDWQSALAEQGIYPTLENGLPNPAYGEAASKLAMGAKDAASSMPITDKMSAGFDAAKAAPGTFLKNNLGYLAAAATPIMADMMVPTTTKQPDIAGNDTINQFIYGPTGYRRLNPVPAKNYGTPAFKPFADGGIVALAGGGVPGYAGTTGSVVGGGGGGLENIYRNLGGEEVYKKIADEYLDKTGGNTAGLAAIMSKYDTPVVAPAAAAPAALTADQKAAMNLMLKSSTSGVDTSAMDALGGSAAVKKLAESAGYTGADTQLYNYAAATPGSIDWTSEAGKQLAMNNYTQNYFNDIASKIKTPAEQALELMYRSTTSGAPTAAFDALGGYRTAKQLAESAGFDATPEWQAAYEKKMGYTVVPRASTAETAAADRAAAATTGTTGTIGSQVVPGGIVDLKTDTGVTQVAKDTTTTGKNVLATTKPADIKSNITTDGTYTGTSGTAPALNTLFGQGKFVGTGTEMGTGTTGPILDFGGTSPFGTTSPLALAKTQIAEQSAAKNAADKTKLDLYSQWGAANPTATNLEHANFVDKIGLDPAVAARLIGISPEQAQNAYNDAKYNKMTGDSEAAYRYLMGQGAYPTKSKVGEIARPYAEATLGMPANTNRQYIYDQATGKYNRNPDYVAEYKDPSGGVNYLMSQKEIFDYFKKNAGQDDATTYAWALANNLTPKEISEATGVPISQIAPKWRAAAAGKAATTVRNTDGTINQEATDKAVADKAAADKAAADTAADKAITDNWDEAAYLAANPDVAAEVAAGKSNFKTGYDHYLAYGKAEGRKATTKTTTKAAGGGMMGYAMGGMPVYAVGGGLGSLGSYSDGGRLLKGPGDGVSDSIPATIGQKQQPARLADGEFVVPARIVSELGNGSTDAGAKKLYAMMDRVQRARGKTTGKNKVAANSRADKYLPA